MESVKTWTTEDILRLHEELEIRYGDFGGGDFLFGWQSINPFAESFLKAVKERGISADYTKYCYMESDNALSDAVVTFHEKLDFQRPEAAFCASSGGTSILFTFANWLSRNEIKEVYYIPPIYFTLLNGLRRLDIRARPTSERNSNFTRGKSQDRPESIGPKTPYPCTRVQSPRENRPQRTASLPIARSQGTEIQQLVSANPPDSKLAVTA
jgi:hypothetical protein